MPSSTIEDYLKAIYFEQQSSKDNLAKTVKLAEKLHITPGTVTTMLKNMSKEGFLDYFPRKGCGLTDKGKKVVISLIRKHRLIELFLQNILHFDWSEVHEEAEIIEHCFSEKIINRINEMLGYPKTDPHGEIIPDSTSTGGKSFELSNQNDIALSVMEEHHCCIVSRVTNQEPDFLRSVQEFHLLPGTRVEVIKRDDSISLIILRIWGKEETITLSLQAAGHIRVKV
jgi:DtxR family Mn-dependent transcriptional regulator